MDSAIRFWPRSSIFRIPWSQSRSFRFRNELTKRNFPHVQITVITIVDVHVQCTFSFRYLVFSLLFFFFLCIDESRTLSVIYNYNVQRKTKKMFVKMSRGVLQRMLLLIFLNLVWIQKMRSHFYYFIIAFILEMRTNYCLADCMPNINTEYNHLEHRNFVLALR